MCTCVHYHLSIHLNICIYMYVCQGQSSVTTNELYLSVLVCRLSDFVEATRSTFQEDLEELGLGAGPFMFSYHEAASLMDTSAFHSPVSSPHSLCVCLFVCVCACMHVCDCFLLTPLHLIMKN